VRHFTSFAPVRAAVGVLVPAQLLSARASTPCNGTPCKAVGNPLARARGSDLSYRASTDDVTIHALFTP
jgi:hypothetical protein